MLAYAASSAVPGDASHIHTPLSLFLLGAVLTPPVAARQCQRSLTPALRRPLSFIEVLLPLPYPSQDLQGPHSDDRISSYLPGTYERRK
ncbi:hypothetical protein NDU88_002178 [Pleurodeles waltl]|uniref:Secreted protein n=1 Tax=Pleurodeles waltl TaxID=8319 RepID=A0AAV7KRF0_PLEWA|nr:hypothetical protein NDU88_002178 [Pleurodeles waltl]